MTAFPGLVPAGDNPLVAAAKNMRIELKAAFPAVKFSVKSRRASMMDAIDVSWIDGPTVDQVDEIIQRYRAGRFDGMDDSYNYERNAWRDAFGDAKYVSGGRSLSDKAILSAMRTLKAQGRISQDATLEQYRRGNLYQASIGGSGMESEQDAIYRAAARRTWALAQKINQISEVEA